jgi:hypothetical protein
MLDNAPQPPAASLARVPESGHLEQVDTLTRVCVDDMLSAFGLAKLRRSGVGRLLELLFWIPARHLARQVAIYDRIVGQSGLGAGGVWALERMARHVEVAGRENVPREGPLLLVANHPGLADTVALFATIPRSDLRVVAAKRPFLDALPNTSRHLLNVAEASPGRFGLIRATTRHLRGGGAVLTFPGGRIEPDPAVLPGAIKALERWSASVDLFTRLVPGLTIVPALVSGVLSPAALRNPLSFLRRRKEDREWLAATLQMLAPALYGVSAKIEFGQPIYADAEAPVVRAVLEETRRLIERCGAR